MCLCGLYTHVTLLFDLKWKKTNTEKHNFLAFVINLGECVTSHKLK